MLFLMFALAVVPSSARAQERSRDAIAGATHLPEEKGKEAAKTNHEAAAENWWQANHETKLGPPFMKNILLDQKAIWTGPSRVRLHDATWLVPLGGLTAALLATDRDTSKHLSSSPDRLNRSRKISDFGAASFVGAAGGLYLWGRITHDDHKRETGLLSGEALINSLALNTAIKFAAGRERPLQENGRGSFGQDGRSFPSDHAAAAWSVASVIAHEYPGPLTKLLAYGLASAVSASRVTSKEHFPSDVLVGSAIGWFVGRQVYRAHHNPELGGDSWDSFSDARKGESERQPENMGSPYVPLDSWIYPALERLAALGYIDTAFLGLRPWTRAECVRLIDEAADHMREEASDPPESARLYRALEKEFAGDLDLLGGEGNRGWRLESVYTRFTGIAGTPLRDGYHFGQTIVNDNGRSYAEGANVVTGFSGRASSGPFAIYVRGEYQHAPSSPALSQTVREVIAEADATPVQPATPFPSVNQFRLLDTYVAVNHENWQISFGKQSLWWGPGQGGPLLLSNNAEPIYMLRINRMVPFKLPSVFGRLGPMRIDSFFGKLSGHRYPARPFIHGQKISFKPTPNLEFGFSRTVILSGVGRPLTLRRFLRSFLSLGGEGNLPETPDNDPGDRRAGFDFTYRVPGLRRWLILYNDSLVDDDPSPLAAPRRAAMNPGIYVPQIPGVPRLDFRVEAAYTDVPADRSIGGKFIYWNILYQDSHTNKGNLLGSWVGREGRGIQLWSRYWLSPQNTIQVGYRHGEVSADFIQGGGTLNDVAVRADLWVRPDLSISSFVQYEKWSFPVLSSSNRSNVTASFQFTFWPQLRSK